MIAATFVLEQSGTASICDVVKRGVIHPRKLVTPKWLFAFEGVGVVGGVGRVVAG